MNPKISFVVPVWNGASYVQEAIERFIASGEFRRQIAENGRALAREKYAPGVVAEQTVAAYRRVADARLAGEGQT